MEPGDIKASSRRRKPRGCAAAAALCLGGLVTAQSATAAVTIGRTQTPSVACQNIWVTQIQRAPASPNYDAPSAGVITSWRIQTNVNGGRARLKIFRPAGGSNFTIVGEGPTQTLAPGTLNEFPVRIPVQGGDRLGIVSIGDEHVDCAFSGVAADQTGFNSGDPAPGSTTSSSPGLSFALINVAAVLEGDPDGDGFGDETQDNCPRQANASQSNIDSDANGDACDDDADGDGLAEAEESRRGTDPLRADTDGDGVPDSSDNCATTANGDQGDLDDDGRGTVCDPSEWGACANVRVGTGRADTLRGTNAGDRLFGLRGNDTIDGRDGEDCIDGGPGRDKLMGSSGGDELEGGDGDDTLSGGSGRDNLDGGAGRNRYSGGAGNDVINAANGRGESVDCGSGRDHVRADRADRLRNCERIRRVR